MALDDSTWIASNRPVDPAGDGGRPPLAGRSPPRRVDARHLRASRPGSIAPSRRWPGANMAPASFLRLVAIWLAAVGIILAVVLILRWAA